MRIRLGSRTVRAVAFAVGTLLMALSSAVGAQQPTGIANVDSADAARAAWRRGMVALRAADTLLALREVDRAANAWPTQPTYLWGRVRLAALRHDTAAVLSALTTVAHMGLGRQLGEDPAMTPYLKLPAFRGIVAAIDSNLAAMPISTPHIMLGDSTLWPEGVDYDRRTKRFYITSVRHRTIVEWSPGGKVRELWPRGQSRLGAVLGVRVDHKRGILWATMSGIPQMAGYVAGDSAIAALVSVRMRDGAILRRWDLPVTKGGHVLGDLAIGPRGDVFITDSNEPFVYRLRAGADTLERMSSPYFRSLQGVAPAPDGKTLYVADYSHGLLRVSLADGSVQRLDDAPNSTSLGIDGIVYDRGAIIAVQNGFAPARIMRYLLDARGQRIVRAEVLDRRPHLADEPTIGTIAGSDFVYVANSQWEKHDAKGVRNPAVALAPPMLIMVPLRPAPKKQ